LSWDHWNILKWEPVSKRPTLANLQSSLYELRHDKRRWAQISILKILNVFFRLKYSPAFLSRILAGDLDQTETF